MKGATAIPASLLVRCSDGPGVKVKNEQILLNCCVADCLRVDFVRKKETCFELLMEHCLLILFLSSDGEKVQVGNDWALLAEIPAGPYLLMNYH